MRNQLLTLQTLLWATLASAWVSAPITQPQTQSTTALAAVNPADVALPLLLYAGAVGITLVRSDKPTFQMFKNTGIQIEPKKIEVEGTVVAIKEKTVVVKEVAAPEKEVPVIVERRQVTEAVAAPVEQVVTKVKDIVKDVKQEENIPVVVEETKANAKKTLDEIKMEVARTKESIAATEAIAKKNKAAKAVEDQGSFVDEEEVLEPVETTTTTTPKRKSKRALVRRVLKKVVMPWKKFSDIQ